MSAPPSTRVDLGRHLCELTRTGATGILTLTRARQKRLICLERGVVLHVASNVIEEQLEDRLLSAGLIDHATTVRAQVEGRKAGTKLSATLVDLDVLPLDRLRDFITQHITDLLLDALTWTDVETNFVQGRPNLAGEITVNVNLLALVYEYALTHPESIDEVRVGIGPPDSRPRLATGSEAWVPLLDPDPAGVRILQLTDGSRDVFALTDQSDAEPDVALRRIHALLVTGILEIDTEANLLDSAADGDTVSRKEVKARIARALDATHYEVLGLSLEAPKEAIREAYYFLARRYHPDRFRSGEMQDLLGPIETFFSQVTEAYNTLFDAARREQYNEELEESGGRGSREPQQDAAHLARENFARGRLLAEKKQYQDAVRFFENAIELDGKRSVYHLELGRVLALNPRRRAEAEPFLRRAIELAPAVADGYLALGDLLRRIGKPGDAAAMFREALTWEPGNLQATTALEELASEIEGGGKRKGLFGG